MHNTADQNNYTNNVGPNISITFNYPETMQMIRQLAWNLS